MIMPLQIPKCNGSDLSGPPFTTSSHNTLYSRLCLSTTHATSWCDLVSEQLHLLLIHQFMASLPWLPSRRLIQPNKPRKKTSDHQGWWNNYALHRYRSVWSQQLQDHRRQSCGHQALLGPCLKTKDIGQTNRAFRKSKQSSGRGATRKVDDNHRQKHHRRHHKHPQPVHSLNEESLYNASQNTLATRTWERQSEIHNLSTSLSTGNHMPWPISFANLRVTYGCWLASKQMLYK